MLALINYVVCDGGGAKRISKEVMLVPRHMNVVIMKVIIEGRWESVGKGGVTSVLVQ